MTNERIGILKLESTRVWRSYKGGALLEEWQGRPEPHDGEFPEEWVASTVEARNPGGEHIENEGLSRTTAQGRPLLEQLIESDPVALLGKAHYEKYGCSMSVLVKLIDSFSRLIIQVHPDKEFARRVLSSDYGKTEAWYIIGGREVAGVEPYVLLGFKPGMTQEKWVRLFAEQDIDGMIYALNKIAVKPGEVYLIEGGVPHAIGSGCFLIEIQEPTDYTIRVEKNTPDGLKLPDESCHQGAGFDKMFDCFHYDCYTADEITSKWNITPKLLSSDQGGEEWSLIDSDSTKLFQMNKLVIHENFNKKRSDTFCVAIIVKGRGRIGNCGEFLDVGRGDTLFIPACANDLQFENKKRGIEILEVVLCYPPK
jgi:mannose-6-phosphate isomerase